MVPSKPTAAGSDTGERQTAMADKKTETEFHGVCPARDGLPHESAGLVPLGAVRPRDYRPGKADVCKHCCCLYIPGPHDA